MIRSALAADAVIREYQVRQTGNGIKVACVTGGDLDAAALAARLEQALRRAGLAGPRAGITLAEAIPRDPKTGKVRRFIPLPGQPAPPGDAGCRGGMTTWPKPGAS